MRRLLILSLLSGLMYGLNLFEVETDGVVEPMSLAAFGFVLLAAFLIGEMVAVAKLPRVTGYLVAGVVFGPDMAGFFGREVVDDLELINSLAVGLIALTAGGELKVPELKANLRGILTVITTQAVVIIPLIFVTVFFGAPYLIDWSRLGVEPTTTLLLAFGAMLGALAIGNSPAVSVAIVNDSGAKGPFTSMNLGVTITKDLVVVVLFSITTALAIGQLSPGGEGFVATLGDLGLELGKSMFTGVLIAAALWAYLRWVHTETLLFLLGLIFLGMFVAQAWHLEKILVFIVAGFLIENFSERGDDMIHAIERISPPVYVVFFAIAGAGLELGAIRQMLLISGVLVAVRAFGMVTATRIGTRLSGLRPLFQRKLGMGFLSQAGVTLGLVIIATEKLDMVVIPGSDLALGSALFSPIMLGVVACNLLVGPILLKLSLSASGETAEQRLRDQSVLPIAFPDATTEDAVACEPLYPDSGVTRGSDTGRLLPPPPPMPTVDFKDLDLGPDLAHSLTTVRASLETALEELRWDYIELQRAESRLVLERLRDHVHFTLSELLSRIANVSDLDAQRQWIRRARVALAEAFYTTLREERSEEFDADADDRHFARFFASVERIPEHAAMAVAVDELPYLYVPQPSDGPYLRARKALSRARIRFTSPRERVVRMRRLIEFYITGPLPPNLIGVANMSGYQRLYFWRKVSALTRYIDGQICDTLRTLADPLLIDPEELSKARDEGDGPAHPDTVERQVPGPEEVREQAIALEKAAAQTYRRLDRLAAAAEQDFEQAIHDIDAYADELHSRFRSTLAHSYDELVEACRIAGTYQLPERRVNTSKVYDLHREGRQEVAEAMRRWRLVSLGFSSRLLAVLDIIDLQHVAFGRVAEAKINVANALLNELRPVPVSVLHRVRAALRTVKEHFGDDIDAAPALALVENIRSELTDQVSAVAIEKLEASRDRGRYMDILEPFEAALSEDSIRLTHTYEVLSVPVEGFAEGVTPHAVKLENMPLRELARELLGGEVAVKLAPVNGIINRTVESALSGIADIQRVISFNLDAASTEVQNYVQSPETTEYLELAREFAVGGLQRSLHRLDELIAQIDRAEQQVGAMIQYETFQQLQRLREMAVTADTSQINAFLAHRSSEGRAARAAAVTSKLERGFLHLRTFHDRYVGPVLSHTTRVVRRRLGVEPLSAAPLVELTDEASFAAVQNKDVPATYRRLFTTVPVELEEFFVARQNESSLLQRAFERFQQGRPTSVLVAGDAGAGVTSLIDHTLRHIDAELPIHRMFFSHNFQSERQLTAMLGDLLGEKSRDLDRLRARLRNTKHQRIVVIEGLHNFFLRTVDGFEALQKFLLLVSETSQQFFWLITINADAHRYLRTVLPFDDHLTYTVALEPLDEQRTKNLIEARHNVSGYKLRFLRDPHVFAPGRWPWGEPRQEQLQTDFYRQLAKVSRGNTTLALYYWLRSLRAVTEEDLIEVGPLEPLDTRFISALGADKLIALGSLISHGGLSLVDFARVFRVSRNDAQGLLRGLVQLNLLVVEPGRVDTYRVNQVLYPLVAQVLRARRVL